MGKPRKIHRQNRFQYDRNRSKEWKKLKKLPPIECKQIKKAWKKGRSVAKNMRLMGLSADPNKTFKIPTAKELLMEASGETSQEIKTTKKQNTKNMVVSELEEEANAPHIKTLQLSEPEVRYCVYMMEKYGEDYKAMARDRKNYYQDTPKQIKAKIRSFKNTASQYNAYIKLKDVVPQSNNECTPEKVAIDMAVRKRKVTRKYIAKRRNGHYTSPKAPVKLGNTCTAEVAIHKVKRKLHFGRKPPTPRENESGFSSKPTKREKSPKKRKQDSSPQRKQASPKKRKLSKEILDLLQMADHFIFTEKLRSKNSARYRMSHGDHLINHGAYKLHSSPEFTNLTHGRQS